MNASLLLFLFCVFNTIVKPLYDYCYVNDGQKKKYKCSNFNGQWMYRLWVYRVKAQHDESTTKCLQQCVHIYFIFPVYIIIKLVGEEVVLVNYPC